ncbi:S-adenosyl-L-methionine-dependent methyltransferase [Rhodocollybia butyracea]|uniref:S-adenosyl-L-methionine-dependent methyltransferase n=1 Tax=Rhodocollybia butyracea TaxID=206335 RepID=A0A9P5U3Z3_9AGAR|nr:S-adenosyl-L-methionine-dependent methyltransferase [Rhodocollybia butyracea]
MLPAFRQRLLSTQSQLVKASAPYLPLLTPSSPAPYPLPTSSAGVERRRLDDMHYGIAGYLKGLTYAPIRNPSQILELGSGTGAWASDAAATYPGAHVVAADMSPLPESLAVPPNMTYKQMNFLEPFPFRPETFDVVHMRFVMIHLPNPDSYISRLAALLRPGGWLLLEDVNHTLLDAKRPVGPGVQALYRGYYEHMRRQGVDPGVGARLKTMLQTSKKFSEVNETVIPCYMNPKSTENPELQNLGEILKYSIDGVYVGIMEKVGPIGGITPEILRGWRREVNDPVRDLRIDMHLTWSKKHEIP